MSSASLSLGNDQKQSAGIRFVLDDEDRIRESYVLVSDRIEALEKPAGRFPGSPQEIRIESIEERHGNLWPRAA